MNNRMKVIGVFAHQGMNAVCIEGNSCLIAGSQEKMEEYFKLHGVENKHDINIKKTRYGEIKQGMELGGSYSFDEESYERFYKYGKMDKLKLKEWDKEEANKGKKYITLRLE